MALVSWTILSHKNVNSFFKLATWFTKLSKGAAVFWNLNLFTCRYCFIWNPHQYYEKKKSKESGLFFYSEFIECSWKGLFKNVSQLGKKKSGSKKIGAKLLLVDVTESVFLIMDYKTQCRVRLFKERIFWTNTYSWAEWQKKCWFQNKLRNTLKFLKVKWTKWAIVNCW